MPKRTRMRTAPVLTVAQARRRVLLPFASHPTVLKVRRSANCIEGTGELPDGEVVRIEDRRRWDR